MEVMLSIKPKATDLIYRLTLIVLITLVSACSIVEKPNLKQLSSNRVEEFKSKDELIDYVSNVSALINYRNTKEREHFKELYGDDIERIEVTGSRVDSTFSSITNNQVNGIDEGDIVKVSGDYLLILRQGKIYSVRLSEYGAGEFNLPYEIDVIQPGWGKDVWYDELLVVEDIVLVLGYSYSLDASQILRFKINDNGIISYKDGIAIKSNDYFSSDNYASRLFKGKYLTYLPVELIANRSGELNDLGVNIPKFARLNSSNADNLIWEEIVKPSDIYKPNQIVTDPILHTIITCSPLSENFECMGKGLISSNNYEYFVSQSAFYLWTYALPKSLVTDFNFDENWNTHYESTATSHMSGDSKLFKLEHLSQQFKVVDVDGVPVDQFSFYESEGVLNIVSVNNPWSKTKEKAQLFQIPKDEFDSLSKDRIMPSRIWYLSPNYINNRFVESWLVLGYYADINGGYKSKASVKPQFTLYFKSLNTAEDLNIELGHSVDRIETVGRKLFISGIDTDFNFNVSIINIENKPFLEGGGVFEDFLEHDTRSHAFNFAQFDNHFGVAGITAYNKVNNTGNTLLNDFYWEENVAANIIFFGLAGGYEVIKAGEVKSHAKQISLADKCEVSCVDWYGNSRPFFINERIFVLTGDELIESQLVGNQVEEIKRINIKTKSY